MADKIVILPEAIANRIAAGEIVERPASVIRELLDNAIDAGADRIEIDLEAGGLRLMRVTDNGHGIDPDGLLMAFERHATSKIHNLEDLDSINTLGFRGEALPSIASVARVAVESFDLNASSGARLKINGGKVESIEKIACPPGTRITVRNLFYNTPARRKFLKSEKTEYSHVYETVVDHALSYTRIHFILRENGRTAIDTPAVDVWSARIASLFGNKFMTKLMSVKNIHPEIRLEGMICHPNHLRSTGRAQRLFVNGRRIRDRIVTQAIYRGYAQYITSKGHPVYFLRIELPPEMVDVNVHPAKSEVRFRDSSSIFNLVSTAVNQVLSGSMKKQFPDILTGNQDKLSVQQPINQQPFNQKPFNQTDQTQQIIPTQQTVPETGQKFIIPGNNWRLVGQVFNTFILVEFNARLLIIDQHTAHERLLFETFKNNLKSGNVPSQTLLFPAPVELDLPQFQVIGEFLDLLRTMGLQLEPFGKNTYIVTAMPDHLHQEEPELLIKNLADELLEIGTTERSRIAERKMLVSLACRKAIKAGDPMKFVEMEALIREIMEREIPNACPHGRPIVVVMEESELARKFKR
ncbi:DNA mismatch repair endonuclease MutL [bacterium]|nr:DNA mismatch repair endonuclease MutL [bacterium]